MPNQRLIGTHYHLPNAIALVTGAIIIGDADGAGEELAPGTDGYILTMVSGSPAWAASPGAAAHNLLSATHTDTTAAAAVRGDIITAQGVSPLWTRLAKASPASGVRALLGFDNGDNEPAYKTTLDTTTPVTITAGSAGAAGTSLIFAHRDHEHPAPATYAATAHNLLSATHGDTLAGAVARGSIVIGNATPKWSALAIGASGTYLRSDGTDGAWTAISAADIAGLTPGVILTVLYDASGATSGSATTFTVPDFYEANTTRVWLNGLLQRPIYDYDESATYDGIVMVAAPAASDELLIEYMPQGV